MSGRHFQRKSSDFPDGYLGAIIRLDFYKFEHNIVSSHLHVRSREFRITTFEVSTIHPRRTNIDCVREQ